MVFLGVCIDPVVFLRLHQLNGEPRDKEASVADEQQQGVRDPAGGILLISQDPGTRNQQE